MKERRGKGIIIITLVIMTAIVTYIVLNIVFSPYWDSIYTPAGYLSFASMRNAESDSEIFSREKACSDIDYVVKCLKRVHPACIDGVPQEVLDRAEDEKSSFTDEVTAYDLWRSTSRVLHEMNDAHTSDAPSFPMNYLSDYSDMIYSGAELSAVNGETVEQIFKRNSDIVSYELDAWGVNVVEGLVGTREGLKYLGINYDRPVYTYRFADGSTVDKSYSSEDFYSFKAIESNDGETEEPYYSKIIKESRTAILTIDSCVYDADYKEFIFNFYNEVRENNVTDIIIDLRNNNGGTSEILDDITMYLDHDSFKTPAGEWRLGPYMMRWESEENKITHMDGETLFDGDVYILTSSDTFSSATLIAEIMRDNGFAEIVGEPCGNMPESYGDVAVFQTPNSAITFQISTKYFKRIDGSKAGEPLLPDIATAKNDALLTAMDLT